MDRPLDAFHYVQRAKARTFLDRLGNVRVSPSTTDDPRLAEEEETLRGEIQALDAQLREEWAKPGDQRSDEAIQSLAVQLAQKRDTYAQLIPRLKLENPEYASLVTVNTLALTQTQRLLTGSTLVEYYVLPEQTLAFVVTFDSFHAEAISVTQETLYDEISTFYLQTQTSLEGIPSSLQNLYDLLIAPVEPHLNTRSLIIAPHSILHYVPFAALHDGERYFLEQHTLTQLPSASILPFILEKRKATAGPPLVLGDPDGSLPFSRQEAQAVAELYEAATYVGDQALERLVWEQGAEAGILHLSTHGIYNPVSPLFSRVLLAPDAEEEYDGYLEVHEVFNLNLQGTDLVVLSACQTNLGERSAGDEIVGLNRAFIYAGAPSVLATLWSVEDAATKDLMVAFYGYLDEGYAKGEALRQAQVDVLQNPDTAHPYYWAGFVLTGDAGEGKSVENTEEQEPIEEAEEIGTTEDVKVEPPDVPDRTWLWFVGVVVLLAGISSGVWMIWKGRKSHG